MKYNINDVDDLMDEEVVERFPVKKGPKKMKKHHETEEKKKERHARRTLKESMEMVLSESDED